MSLDQSEATGAAVTTTAVPATSTAPATRSWPGGTQKLRYGGDYNPEQWPRDTWLEDIALMQQTGINLVSIGIFSWALLEPRDGEFDFTFLDDIMDLLASAGIDVDLGTPTAAPPAWFWKKYPQARPVTREGVQLGHGSRGMASPSSPDYRRHAARITGELARRYAGHPALRLWHVHNEYGAPISECYSDASVVAFREWLGHRYGSLDAVNDAWGTTFWGQRYGSWEEIDAPRLSATVVNPAQRLDFKRFTSDSLLECYVLERDTIREYTPDLPVTTNFMATSCPSLDYWSWAREVDVVANDHYLTAERTDNHVLLALDADFTRSLAGGKPWMLMEHSTSAVNWQPRNIAKRPGEMTRNSLGHVARGADAVMFFQFRASRSGAEKFHSAMVPHQGTDSRIFREVTELGHLLGRSSAVRGSTVDARVAILWDQQSFWAQDLEWRPSEDLDHRERIEAWYTALWQRNVTVDFAHPEQDLGHYDLVLAPALYAVSAAARENLEAYVAEGGNFVVSFFSGIVDDHDAVPAGGHPGQLRAVLGLTVAEWLPLRRHETVTLDDGSSADIWAEDIELHGARTRTSYTSGPAEGQAAITVNTFGKGTAWYVSTRPTSGTLDALLGEALAATGIPDGPSTPGVETVTRTGDGVTFTFVLNHTDVDAPLPVGGSDLVSGRTVSAGELLAAGACAVIEKQEK
ncbi:beta-galactosidase [Arthrobacter sp. Leaf234]|uniref:beta-galactosidase n=1 Tax=Arthrobacter sp. Leaf234 TaxID=1736303 RepID=UPI000700F92A|nr:beta-galactosidase [Arthrobacter sp. Leaf234]KQO03284.1 beta-galactosidase [Arthrobacter sp. Leaf234]